MITQEDIFTWFKSLSGAKRIELMCGLMSMCIPLEIRFFEAYVKDMTKKDYNAFCETEMKANSIKELQMICKCDLLSEKTNEYDNNEINGGVGNSGGDDVSTSTNSTSNEQKTIAFSNYPSRSKLIISLCLLEPTNHSCSTLTFNSIREQLMPQNIRNAIINFYIPKNYPLKGLFSEVLLLLTMAIYHPAFSYEQRDLLLQQKQEVEFYIESFNMQLSPVLAVPQPTSAGTAIVTGSGGQQAFYQTNANVTTHHQPAPQHIMHTQPHLTQPPSASSQPPTHSYHQNSLHQTTNKSHHMPPIQQAPQFSIPYLPTHVPIANLSYTAPGSTVSQTNALISNMALLKVNSPQSTSPSPTISPSSAKMSVAQVANNSQIKIEYANTGAGGIPNPMIAFVSDNNANAAQAPGAIQFLNITTGPHNVLVDDGNKSSGTANITVPSTPSSCYNCGNIGHLGTECTSAGGDDNH